MLIHHLSIICMLRLRNLYQLSHTVASISSVIEIDKARDFHCIASFTEYIWWEELQEWKIPGCIIWATLIRKSFVKQTWLHRQMNYRWPIQIAIHRQFTTYLTGSFQFRKYGSTRDHACVQLSGTRVSIISYLLLNDMIFNDDKDKLIYICTSVTIFDCVG